MPPKKQSNELTQGRAKRALQVGSLATSVSGSYAWQALKQPFQSAGDKEQELLDLHLGWEEVATHAEHLNELHKRAA